MNLVIPNKKYQHSYLQYIQELGEEERYPFPLDFEYSDFDGMLEKLEDFVKGRNLPNGFVPSSTLWLVENHELIGVTNLRHYLNRQIEYSGGHIGLGIRPSKRGKGLGKLLMQLSISELHKLKVNPIHIHCYKENTASARTIIDNGGVFDSEVSVDGKLVQRYLVKNLTPLVFS